MRRDVQALAGSAQKHPLMPLAVGTVRVSGDLKAIFAIKGEDLWGANCAFSPRLAFSGTIFRAAHIGEDPQEAKAELSLFIVVR